MGKARNLMPGGAAPAVCRTAIPSINEVRAFVMGTVGGSMVQSVQRREEEQFAEEEGRAEAEQIISSFCSCYPASRVEPTEAEIEMLAANCSALSREAVTSAIYNQLTWCTGSLEWQPRQRILSALEYFCQQGGALREITRHVVAEASPLLEVLAAEVPKCREKATRLRRCFRDGRYVVWLGELDPRDTMLEPARNSLHSFPVTVVALPASPKDNADNLIALEFLSSFIGTEVLAAPPNTTRFAQPGVTAYEGPQSLQADADMLAEPPRNALRAFPASVAANRENTEIGEDLMDVESRSTALDSHERSFSDSASSETESELPEPLQNSHAASLHTKLDDGPGLVFDNATVPDEQRPEGKPRGAP